MGPTTRKPRDLAPPFLLATLNAEGTLTDSGYDVDEYGTSGEAEVAGERLAESLFTEGNRPAGDDEVESIVVYVPLVVYRRKGGYDRQTLS